MDFGKPTVVALKYGCFWHKLYWSGQYFCYFKVYKQSVGKFSFRSLAPGVVTLSPTWVRRRLDSHRNQLKLCFCMPSVDTHTVTKVEKAPKKKPIYLRFQVIQCQNKTATIPCIFRSKVAIQDILSHSQLIHEQTSLDDDIINTPSILDYGATSTVPKHCLKYSIIYQAPHTSHHLQHVVDIIDVPYMVNTVPVSVEFLKVRHQLQYVFYILYRHYCESQNM